MKKKSVISRCFLVLLGILLITGMVAAVPSPTHAKQYKLGFVGALTGIFGALGNDMLSAVKVGIEMTNRKGGIHGRTIELTVYDDTSKVEEMVPLYKKLAGDPEILAIFGPLPSPMVPPAFPLARKYKVPTEAYGELKFGPKDRYMFTAVNTFDVLVVDTFIRYLHARGWTDIGLLNAHAFLGDRWHKWFTKEGPKHGLRVVAAERYAMADTDVTPQVAKLRAATPKPKALFCATGAGPKAALVYKGARTLGWDVPIFYNTSVVTKTFLKLLGPVPKKDLVMSGGSPNIIAEDLPDYHPVKAAALEFNRVFKEMFGQRPYLSEAIAFDSSIMVLRALEAAGPNPTREKIRDLLENMHYVGVYGTFKRSSDPRFHCGMAPPMFMATALGDTWVKAD